MGKLVIKCARCGSDKWIPRENPNPEIPKGLDKECSACKAIYCAANRKYAWLD